LKKKWLNRILITVVILSLVTVSLVSWTPAIRDSNRQVIEESIASLEQVSLGGIEQHILIRGQNKNNPVLLFLHGGPGYPQISFARKFQSKLEKDFVVVQWDQRGSGKSYSRQVPEDSMNREQFISDTIELVEHLSKQFDQEKIYLAGHSWGSDLGVRAVSKRPDLFYAYIGIGQVVHSEKQEQISYEYVYSMAAADGNKKALEDLEEIGFPPYADHEKDVMVQRKWLRRYDGVEVNVNTMREIVLGILFSPEYTWLDGIRFIRGNYFTRETMFNDIKDVNMLEDYPVLPVPVYFMAGRQDYNTPSELVKQYYNQLDAPIKEFFWFENSAHDPHFEEPEKFAELMGYILNETRRSK